MVVEIVLITKTISLVMIVMLKEPEYWNNGILEQWVDRKEI